MMKSVRHANVFHKFEFDNLIKIDSTKETAQTFTQVGGNAIVTEQGSTAHFVYKTAAFNQRYITAGPPDVRKKAGDRRLSENAGERRRLDVAKATDYNGEEMKAQDLSEEWEPAHTIQCPAQQGSANVYADKFQQTKCLPCQ